MATFNIRENSLAFIESAIGQASRDTLQALGRAHLATFGEPLSENEHRVLVKCQTAPTRDFGFKLPGAVRKPVRSPYPVQVEFVPDF
jgi:hypothetical protein